MNKNVQNDIRKLKNLEMAIIDSSSLIYLEKLDLLDTASRTIRLFVPATVFDEINFNVSRIRKVECQEEKHSSTDKQVLTLAKRMHCPLISEDKKILQKARREGLDYFNTLMVILLLYLRRLLSKQATEEKWKQLKQIAWYEDWIWAYGQEVFDKIVAQAKPK